MRDPRPLLVAIAAVLLALSFGLGAAPGGVAPAATPGDELRPGEFLWAPELAPEGPVVVVISLPAQRAYVYRNGVRIGTSTTSTGKPGYPTPAGIYSILQKHREHYSNLYDNAPMPFMQRLSWDGLALHEGSLPGYPASHGCVRLPAGFAEQLFGVTQPGTLVVIAESGMFPPAVVSPGLFSPVDAATGAVPSTPRARAAEWAPERAPAGPLTLVLSIRDRELVVLRNAVEIGRTDLVIRDPPAIGTRAFVLLEGSNGEPSPVLPDRPALRWLAVRVPGSGATEPEAVRQAIESGQIVIPPEFAARVYPELRPGSTVVVTDEPLGPLPAEPALILTDHEVPPDQ